MQSNPPNTTHPEKPTTEDPVKSVANRGAVLLFAPYLYVDVTQNQLAAPNWGQTKIKELQQVMRGPKNHQWITHVGISLGENNETHRIQLAHVTEAEINNEILRKYIKEDLVEERKRHATNEDRSFISFSPNGEHLYKKYQELFGPAFMNKHQLTAESLADKLGQYIANAATIDGQNQEPVPKWRFSGGAVAIVKAKKLKTKRKVNLGKKIKQEKSQICSEFGTRSVKIGALELMKEVYQQAKEDTTLDLEKITNQDIKDALREKKEVSSLSLEATNIPGYLSIPSSSVPKYLYHALNTNECYTKKNFIGDKPRNRFFYIIERIALKEISDITSEKFALFQSKVINEMIKFSSKLDLYTIDGQLALFIKTVDTIKQFQEDIKKDTKYQTLNTPLYQSQLTHIINVIEKRVMEGLAIDKTEYEAAKAANNPRLGFPSLPKDATLSANLKPSQHPSVADTTTSLYKEFARHPHSPTIPLASPFNENITLPPLPKTPVEKAAEDTATATKTSQKQKNQDESDSEGEGQKRRMP